MSSKKKDERQIIIKEINESLIHLLINVQSSFENKNDVELVEDVISEISNSLILLESSLVKQIYVVDKYDNQYMQWQAHKFFSSRKCMINFLENKDLNFYRPNANNSHELG